MGKIVKISFSVAVAYLISSGCSSSNPVSPENCPSGHYCYKSIDFGETRGADYEAGIRDGCKTGEGTFTKDYYKSSSSKDYYDGWIVGRSHCKQILPNEGTRQAEINSRKRAEYQIQKLKLEQSSQESSEEGIVDSLLKDNSEDTQTVEY